MSTPTCLEPTLFSWGSERPEFGFDKISDDNGNPIVANDPYVWGNFVNTIPTEFPIATTVGDFDGDGTREIVVVDVGPNGNEKYLISRTAEGVENWRLKLTFAQTGEVIYGSAGAGTYYGFGSGSVPHFSDVDNDGRVDLTAIVADATSSTGSYLDFSRWNPQGSVTGLLDDNFTLINTNIPVNGESGFPQIEWVDMNNDGRTDAILIETLSVGDEFFLHFKLYLNETNNAGLATVHTFSTIPIEFDSPNAVSWGERPQFSDYDGNGQIDFGIVSKKVTNQGDLTITHGQAAVTHIVFNPLDDPENPDFTAIPVWGSTATGAFGLPSDPRETYHQMMDVNGDGLLDMLFVPNCRGGSLPVGWYLQLNLGNKQLATPQLLAGFDPGGYSECNNGQAIRVPIYAGLIKVGDWNNDGRTDLIVPTQIHEAICWSPRTVQNADGPILYCPDHPDGTVLADVFAEFPPGEPGTVRKIHYVGKGAEDRSTYYSAIWQFEKVGDGFKLRRDSEEPVNSDNPIVSVRSSLSDTNGDGVTEVLHQIGCIGVDSNLPGNSISTPDTKCSGDYLDAPGLQSVYSSRALGDSRGYYTTPLQQTADATLDLLKIATNALGEQAQWDYTPLSSSSNRVGTELPLYTLADRTSGDSYVENGEGDHFYFASSMYVVSEFETTNGLVSGSTPLFNKTFYGYEEAVFNNQGRGFQGFRAVHTERETPGDLANDIRSSTWFHQIFPLAGQIDYSETYLASDVLSASEPISRSSFIWACVNDSGDLQDNCTAIPGPVYRVAPRQVQQEQFDLSTRSLIALEVQDNTYDVYGNILTQGQVNTDYELTEAEIMQRTNTLVNEYEVDEASWWLNRLRSAQQTSQVDYQPGYQPPATLADSPEAAQTLTRLIGWDTALRKPNCDYVIGGSVAASGSSDSCSRLPNNIGPQTVRTTHIYAAHGNLAEQYILATDMLQSRTTTSVYSADGYFVASLTNALEHTLSTETDPREGQPLQITDALGRITAFEYDPFGRELERYYPKFAGADIDTLGNHYAPRVSTRYIWQPEEVNDPSWAYTLNVYPDGAPVQTETRDRLNRPIKTQTEGFDGPVITTTTYNARGQLASQTAPRYVGDTAYSTTFSYDALGRMLKKDEPRQTDTVNSSTNLYTHYRYHGLETHIFSGSADSQPPAASCNVGATTHLSLVDQLCVRRTYGANQQPISTTDAHGQQTHFWANALGHVSLIADPHGNLTAASYNALGQRTELFDPNMGHWQFNYNGLGELRSQIDANNSSSEFEYDLLGRLLKRTTQVFSQATVTDQWHYDDDAVPEGLPGLPGAVPYSNQFRGLLGSSTRTQGGELVYARVYAYESNKGYLPAGHRTEMLVDGGLPESYTLGIDNDSYFARPKAITYPYTLPNDDPVFRSYILYNQQGFITQEGGSQQFDPLAPESSGFYRRVEAMSAYGTVTQELYGNGLYQDSVDYAATGQLAARHVTTTQGVARLDYNYTYDRWGNLSEQKTEGLSRRENFSYDQLHRLTRSERFTSNVKIPGEEVNYFYDALGNFTDKSDFATDYSYGGQPMASCFGASNAGPNAVTSVDTQIGIQQYAYDANGNMLCISGRELTISYDGFNKPITLEKRNGEYTEFSYGPDNARYAQQGTRNNVRYIDKLYERINQSTHKLYLGDYAILTYGTVDPSAGLVYQHRDRLGSMVGLSDANGILYTDGGRAFDAFGKPREGDWKDSNGETWPIDGDLNRDDLTTRGFTQHEHLNGFDLIHMNGRAYDYNLGRFLSVDPFIQFPENSQSLNPYSYIMNNPMSGTDPTGYCQAETGTHRRSCVTVTVNDTGTGTSRSASLNKLHSDFGKHVTKIISSILGNGAQVTGVSTKMSDGSVSDLMSTQSRGAKQSGGDSGFGIDDAASIGMGLTPAGVYADVYTAITGEDAFTEDKVSGFWRWAGIIPFVSEARKVTKGRKALSSSQVPNAGGKIISYVTKQDEVFFRVFSGDATRGSFLTRVAPTSQRGAIEGLALPPSNSAEFIQRVIVPAGTRLQRSRALPAFGHRGGKEQFQLLDEIPNANFGPKVPFK